MRNISGDREVEWRFIRDNMPDGPDESPFYFTIT